jgi:hypothetical protein
MGMAPAARRPVVNAISLYTVPRPAVEAPNYHLLMCHFHPQSFSNIIIICMQKVNTTVSQPSLAVGKNGVL